MQTLRTFTQAALVAATLLAAAPALAQVGAGLGGHGPMTTTGPEATQQQEHMTEVVDGEYGQFDAGPMEELGGGSPQLEAFPNHDHDAPADGDGQSPRSRLVACLQAGGAILSGVACFDRDGNALHY
ncbi:hypothetical protein HKCCE3408_17645 [Rhodobacterales bacterium HKCCE3408]|nr:hypothetical protein [Rhodobacterales bacterium HKCCE3408]